MKRSLPRWGSLLILLFCLLLSAAGGIFGGAVMAAACFFVIVGLFVFVAATPACEQRENLWLFVLSACALLPLNLTGAFYLRDVIEAVFYMPDSAFARVVRILLLLHMLFAAEEIVLGAAARLIFGRQYKVSIDPFE